MLTKDLLRFRSVSGTAKPSFIDADDPALLHFAGDLIAVYENGQGIRREDLEQQTDVLTRRKKDLKLARGLVKILDDRSEFSMPGEVDYAALRREVFTVSAKHLLSGNVPEHYEEFREKVFQETPALQKGIYADLPENEVLLSFRKTFPKELLERYNLSLVQSLLLYSTSIDCTVFDESPQELRRMFLYLKFFRLLCHAHRKPDGQFSLKVDGPASILENSLRYGLQLACFFPVLCRLKRWKLVTQLKLHEKVLRLSLDQSSNLKCHYSNAGAYLPEEIRMFKEFFNRESSQWKIGENPGFLEQPDGSLIFPDFVFRHVSGKEFLLELFHQWHKTPLKERLEHCPEGLLLGVDRACIKNDPELAEQLKQGKNAFLFTRFPGVEKVVKLLDEQL